MQAQELHTYIVALQACLASHAASMRATMQSSRPSRACGNQAGAFCSCLRGSRVLCMFLKPADPLPLCILAQDKRVGRIPHIPNCGHWRQLRHVPGDDGAGRARCTALRGRGAVRSPSPALLPVCSMSIGVCGRCQSAHRATQPSPRNVARHGLCEVPCSYVSSMHGSLALCIPRAAPPSSCFGLPAHAMSITFLHRNQDVSALCSPRFLHTAVLCVQS